jgi:hypothetical protein
VEQALACNLVFKPRPASHAVVRDVMPVRRNFALLNLIVDSKLFASGGSHGFHIFVEVKK